MLNFFVSQAQAQAAGGGAATGGSTATIIMLVAFVLIFYFLLWRPQSKRAKAQRQMLSQLNKGDEVVIGGGIAGRIVKVGDEFLTLQISEGTDIVVQKGAVSSVLPKNTLKSI
ncbi:preprotein translocase subunit YajC [Carnimonas nigrificans]|uniref:preprotein translocase subunit YajC n=1 Tax=Carnimonas nigrificans TaxID=64323 RepID=UPI00046FA3A6|nr:preprotein translocase subunit YajC [Carnimonas nigrificans]